MTTDERAEIDEWMEMIEKSINRVKREFDNFKRSIDKMTLTVERTNEKHGDEKGYSGKR